MKEYITPSDLAEEDNFDLKKEFRYYFFFWPWFLGFTLILLFCTFFYLRYEERIYESNAQIQIKKGDSSDPASMLLGGTNLFSFNRDYLDNDIAIITSQHILEQVVKRLDLQTNVYTIGSIVGSINTKLLYNKLPHIEVIFKDSEKSKVIDFNVIDNDELEINIDELNFKILKGQVYDSEDLFIKPKDSLFLYDQTFRITNTSLSNATDQLRGSLIVEAASIKYNGEIINLTIKGTNIERNENILNTLIEVLAEDQVKDKREISKVSIDFIEQRLEGLSKSIDSISKNTITFQLNNNIFDSSLQTSNSLDNITKRQEEAFTFGIQLEIAKALLQKLEDQKNYDILPANIGIANESVNQSVNSYNELATKRSNLLISATEQSPLVKQFTDQLKKAKKAIIIGVERYVESLEVSISSYEQMENKTKGIIAELPSKESTLRSFARNFKIVEELYVFLLQKKEEASIRYISALPNLKILSNGVSNNVPISPNVQSSYLFSLMLGFLIPFVLLYILKLLDTKVNNREDLEQGLKDIAILGEVPYDEKILAGDTDVRGITAESTRVLRSSLSFQINEGKPNVITVTSTTKGEGKSFISYNLAKSYNALGKKVILIGADLRNPQLHNRIGIARPNLGLSSYLSDENYNDIDSIIIRNSSKNDIDFLLSGAIPPNPSELLMRPKMKELIEFLKKQYDFIILDSAPLLLVSDTHALLPISDSVVYVLRAQYSDKNIFSFIKDLQNKPNVPPFGMVLNALVVGANSNYKYQYRYAYRYRYSYSYKYNYGYGYGYGNDKNDKK